MYQRCGSLIGPVQIILTMWRKGWLQTLVAQYITHVLLGNLVTLRIRHNFRVSLSKALPVH